MISVSLSNVLSIMAISITFIGLILGYFKYIQGILEKISKLELVLSERITKVETRLEIFWSPIVNSLVNAIKQPIHVEMDSLLDKLNGQSKEMTVDDLTKLKHILSEEMNGKSKEEHWKYAFLRARIDWILSERGCLP